MWNGGFPAFQDSFRAVAEDYRRSLGDGMFFRFETLSIGMEKLLGRVKKTDRCSPGKERVFVDPEGKLLACPTGIGLRENILGHVDGRQDFESRKLWDQSGPVSAKMLCCSCWAAPLCGGNCRVLSLRNGNGMNDPDPLYCRYMKMCLEHAMWLLSTLDPRIVETMLHGFPEGRGARVV